MTLGELVSRNRTAILGLTLLLTVAGAIAAWSMPVSIFPEVAFHRVTLIARGGDLPVAQTVTAGTQLDLVFDWTADMAAALQAVLGAAAMSAVQSKTRSSWVPPRVVTERIVC